MWDTHTHTHALATRKWCVHGRILFGWSLCPKQWSLKPPCFEYGFVWKWAHTNMELITPGPVTRRSSSASLVAGCTISPFNSFYINCCTIGLNSNFWHPVTYPKFHSFFLHDSIMIQFFRPRKTTDQRTPFSAPGSCNVTSSPSISWPAWTSPEVSPHDLPWGRLPEMEGAKPIGYHGGTTVAFLAIWPFFQGSFWVM